MNKAITLATAKDFKDYIEGPKITKEMQILEHFLNEVRDIFTVRGYPSSLFHKAVMVDVGGKLPGFFHCDRDVPDIPDSQIGACGPWFFWMEGIKPMLYEEEMEEILRAIVDAAVGIEKNQG